MEGFDRVEKLIDLDFDSPPFGGQDEVNHCGDSKFYDADLNLTNEWISSRQNPMSSTPLEARESMIRAQMLARQEEYTELQTYRILVGTWNVNGQTASEFLGDHWLSCDPNPPELYAIGFQELDLSKEAFLFSDSPREAEWMYACQKGLHPKAKYQKVKLVRLVGMMLIVFVRDDLKEFVTNVSAETVGTGILGKMGNKGGVAVRLDFHNSSICFVNSHLAAHVDECERRNQDFAEINSRLVFSSFKPPKFIKDHDHVYWLGDLNYRLMDLSTDQVKSLLNDNAYNILLEHDQLKVQQNLKKVFSGFQEGDIRFQPTYKYDPGTDLWDTSEKNRPPAWCDRILWRGGPTVQLAYRSHMKLNISDHKPVSALFDASIKVVDNAKYRKVYEDLMKHFDKIENEFLPQVMLDKMEVNFKTIMFRQSEFESLTIANTGQVAVHFEFIKKPNDTSYCKEWLKIKPYTAMILPGDSLEIELEVFVDMNTVPKLNSAQEKVEDILVLHLDGGKDFFITVSGTFKPSCFGCSLNTLVRLNCPVDSVPKEALFKLEQNEYKRFGLEQPCWDIPKELWILIDNLYKYHMSSADIFQQTGLITNFHKIRDALDSGWPEKLTGGAFSIAEALLIFLGSLSEPVIPNNFYLRALECSNNFINCKQLVNEIPAPYKNVFYYLIAFLRELLRHSNANKLDSKMLASIFGGIVLRSPENDKMINQNITKQAALANMQSIDRKKAAFIFHFLVNDFDI